MGDLFCGDTHSSIVLSALSTPLTLPRLELDDDDAGDDVADDGDGDDTGGGGDDDDDTGGGDDDGDYSILLSALSPPSTLPRPFFPTARKKKHTEKMIRKTLSKLVAKGRHNAQTNEVLVQAVERLSGLADHADHAWPRSKPQVHHVHHIHNHPHHPYPHNHRAP